MTTLIIRTQAEFDEAMPLLLAGEGVSGMEIHTDTEAINAVAPTEGSGDVPITITASALDSSVSATATLVGFTNPIAVINSANAVLGKCPQVTVSHTANATLRESRATVLDRASVKAHDSYVEAYAMSAVVAHGESEVHLHGNVTATLWGMSRARLTDTAYAAAYESACVIAGGESRVSILDRATGHVKENAEAYVSGSAKIDVSGTASVTLAGNAQATLRGAARAILASETAAAVALGPYTHVVPPAPDGLTGDQWAHWHGLIRGKDNTVEVFRHVTTDEDGTVHGSEWAYPTPDATPAGPGDKIQALRVPVANLKDGFRNSGAELVGDTPEPHATVDIFGRRVED